MALSNTINAALLRPLSIMTLATLREEAGVLAGLGHEFDTAPMGLNETVTVGLAPPIALSSVVPAPYLAAFAPDMTLKYQQVSLANWVSAPFALTNRDIAKLPDYENGWKPAMLTQAVRTVLNDMRSKAYTALLQCNGHVHTTQTTGIINSTDNTGNIVDAKVKLEEQLTPRSSRKTLVISPREEGYALKNVQWTYNYAAGDNRGFRDGEVGNACGFTWVIDNSGVLPQVYANGTDNGAYVLNGSHDAGATALTVQTGAGTIVAGNCIEITDATTGSKFTYAVKTGITQAGAGLTLYEPGLMVANATGSTVKLVGTASTNIHVGGLVFDEGAVLLVNRPPKTPELELGVSSIVSDPLTQISLKVSIIPCFEATQYMVSALYGIGVIDPRRGCRLTYAS